MRNSCCRERVWIQDSCRLLCALTHPNLLLHFSLSCNCRGNNQPEIGLGWSGLRGKMCEEKNWSCFSCGNVLLAGALASSTFVIRVGHGWSPCGPRGGSQCSACGHIRAAGSGFRRSPRCPQRATSAFNCVRGTNAVSEGKVWRTRQLVVLTSNRQSRDLSAHTAGEHSHC